ncbi:MAG TPA: metal ABC transporter substrate-binding protein, partial [Methylomirabilota bacterium]|nr:metal ABC transporter substrate-binding protein [Methylomirabilota bacterium]
RANSSQRDEWSCAAGRIVLFNCRAAILRVAFVPLLAAIVSLLFVVSACPAERRPHIVTSFFPIYGWTASVAGEHAVVENLLSARAEPHDYAFTPSDARKLGQADLIVVNGLGLESWLPRFLRGSPSSRARILDVSAGLGARLIVGEHGHGHGEHDETAHANPHVWLDPQFAAHGVSNILFVLQRIDPAHRAVYASNATAYVARLRKLDEDIRQSLAGAPNRAIVTWHDAFPYLARRYELEIAGVVEEVPDVNPTPKYLSRLGRMMRERGIRVIFLAPGGQTRLARQIASDLRVELVELDTLESGPLSPSAYEERMRHNAAVLQKHLK